MVKIQLLKGCSDRLDASVRVGSHTSLPHKQDGHVAEKENKKDARREWPKSACTCATSNSHTLQGVAQSATIFFKGALKSCPIVTGNMLPERVYREQEIAGYYQHPEATKTVSLERCKLQ